MSMRQEIAVEQLDKRLESISIENLTKPVGGWIQAIRESIGMTSMQLAARLQVDQSVAIRHESRERAETISLGKLREVADALGCELVYAFKPRRPLMEMVRSQAREKARALVGRVSHSMALEDQALSAKSNEEEIDRLAEELLREKWSKLWRD